MNHLPFFRKFAEIFAIQGAPPVSTTLVANLPPTGVNDAKLNRPLNYQTVHENRYIRKMGINLLRRYVGHRYIKSLKIRSLILWPEYLIFDDFNFTWGIQGTTPCGLFSCGIHGYFQVA
jgi:hypothetical protein